MPFKLVMVPPNTQPDWPEKIRAAVPDCNVQLFDSAEAAMEAIVDADAAYGNIVPELFRRAKKLRWIQAPAAAPPVGYYHQELIDSDVIVTNQREIYNDHISAHIMAFVLACARHACTATSRSSSSASGKDRASEPPFTCPRPPHDHRCRRHRRRSLAAVRRVWHDRSGIGPTSP